MSLSFSRVGSADARNTAWILHGILGSGRNWRSFARRLVQAHPDWAFVLPDLRNHGRTGPVPGPHRLVDCAADLAGLPNPDVVLGHSFGGKVALAWAAEGGVAREVWVLDSIPVPTPDSADADVMRVLAGVEALNTPVPDRANARNQLLDRGLPPMLVDWLLTSLEKGPQGWSWVYGVAGIREMMADYFTTDFGPFLADHAGPGHVHLVRAANSDRWAPGILDQLTLGSGASLHTLPDAGHWLHVDNPGGLAALLGRAFTLG